MLRNAEGGCFEECALIFFELRMIVAAGPNTFFAVWGLNHVSLTQLSCRAVSGRRTCQAELSASGIEENSDEVGPLSISKTSTRHGWVLKPAYVAKSTH